MITTQRWGAAPTSTPVSDRLLTTIEQGGLRWLETALERLGQEASPLECLSVFPQEVQMRTKHDGTVDRRTLVKTRPPRHIVKKEAVLVRGPFVQSRNRNAKGQYKIILACDHVIKRPVTNGVNPPVPGKLYACPQCSEASS